VGGALVALGDGEAARSALEAARHLYAATGHLKGEALATRDLAHAIADREPDKARALLAHAASLFGRVGMAEAEAEARTELARLVVF